MTRYLLDTNIISDLVSQPRGSVRQAIGRVGELNILTSIVVVAEIKFGVAKRRSASLASRVDHILSRFEVLPFEPPADDAYAELRADLERRGCPIGANDMLIAAQALAQGMVLVTDNVGEFSRVQGLTVENWLCDDT